MIKDLLFVFLICISYDKLGLSKWLEVGLMTDVIKVRGKF